MVPWYNFTHLQKSDVKSSDNANIYKGISILSCFGIVIEVWSGTHAYSVHSRVYK